MQTTLDNLHGDVIDVRDLMDRIEELEPEIDAVGEGEHITEWKAIWRILEELRDNGGDEQWRGHWYPSYLVQDAHFMDYARELLEDCGTIPRDLPSWVEIDWVATARNVRIDYTPISIDGVTYWYR
jgi:hypothetical protein